MHRASPAHIHEALYVYNFSGGVRGCAATGGRREFAELLRCRTTGKSFYKSTAVHVECDICTCTTVPWPQKRPGQYDSTHKRSLLREVLAVGPSRSRFSTLPVFRDRHGAHTNQHSTHANTLRVHTRPVRTASSNLSGNQASVLRRLRRIDLCAILDNAVAATGSHCPAVVLRLGWLIYECLRARRGLMWI